MKEQAERRLYRKQIQSPIGTICLEADEEALVSLYILESEVAGRWERPEEKAKITELLGQTENGMSTEILEKAEAQLGEYFLGQRSEFDIPVKEKGTEFQRRVWSALRKIPYGETRTYGEVAQMIGNPKACRAVGGANNRNPIMILTPCHRVIGADGSLVGFGGGLDVKRYLLELEKKHVQNAQKAP